MAVLGEQFWRDRRVNAPMDAMEAAGPQCAIDRGAVDAGRQQLPATGDAVLVARDQPNCIGSSSDSEGNSMRFGHTAIVGALAVSAQRIFCDNSAQLLRAPVAFAA